MQSAGWVGSQAGTHALIWCKFQSENAVAEVEANCHEHHVAVGMVSELLKYGPPENLRSNQKDEADTMVADFGQ